MDTLVALFPVWKWDRGQILFNAKEIEYASCDYTVIRIDGKIHQPHRMAPDQTIRAMEEKFDIYEVHIWFFPTFLMEILDRFEVFRL